MSKTLKFMSLLILTLLGFTACSNDSILDDGARGKGNSITFTLQGTPKTYATAAPNATSPTTVQTPALDREKAITSIYAVFFQGGEFVKTVQATGSATYNVDLELAGTFDMYLVANPDADLVNKLQTGITTVNSFEQLIATQSPGEDNTATGFLMTSDKKSVTTSASNTTDAGVFTLVRAAARFDFYNRVEKLNITKITMKNRFVQSRISRGALNTSMEGLTSNSTKTYEAAQGLTSHECIAAMYSYENAFVGGTSLTVEATYNGLTVAPIEIVLEGLPVKRNHLYTIILTEKTSDGTDPNFDPNNISGSLNLSVVVKDWEEGTTIDWNGANSLSTLVPSFSATASAGNLTEASAANPTTLTVTNAAANTVTVKVTGVTVGSKLVHTEGALPTGYSISAGTIAMEGTVPTQTFTITLPQNTTYTKELPFELQNALDPTVKRAFTLTHQGVRVKLPIEYVAEYNVATDGMSFATSHDNDQAGGLFSNIDAVAKFTSIKIDGKAYHLPSAQELLAISSPPSILYIRFTGGPYKHLDVSEDITVNGVTNTYTADYQTTVNKLSYAIKFEGNGDTYKCAYRYELVGDWTAGSNDSRLKVTVRYLGTSSNPSIDDVAKESYWNSNSEKDIVRYFAATGSRSQTGSTNLPGQSVYVQGSDYDAAIKRNSGFSATYVYSQVYLQGYRPTLTSVRLFSDK